MARFVSTSDFTGPYKISQNVYDIQKLQEYLDEYEDLYLQELLGCELFDLFIADLDANNQPQTVRFQEIFNKLCFEVWHCQYISRGIPFMLKAFLYTQYTRDNRILQSVSGAMSLEAENSREVRGVESYILVKENEGIESYQAIQMYICQNSSTYPEFEGQPKNYATWV